MATMTVIDRLPGDWNSLDRFGDGWTELGIDPRAEWTALFDEWLEANYGPHIYRVGNEIHGPATYLFGPENTGGQGRKYQRDTPAIEDLPQLPESLYDEFNDLHSDDWLRAIQTHAARNTPA